MEKIEIEKLLKKEDSESDDDNEIEVEDLLKKETFKD